MALKQFLSDFTKKQGSKDVGKAKRIAFNEKPKDQLKHYGVAGESLGALLTFEAPKISAQVLKETDWTETGINAYTDWLKKFALWEWPEGEEDIYTQPLCAEAKETDPYDSGHTPAYPAPKCHLKRVNATVQGASSQAGRKKVSLEVLCEGALPGAKIECMNTATKESVLAGKVSFAPKSTFRCSLLKATAHLAPGKYRVRVLDDLGQSGTFTIDRDLEGKLPKGFTVS